MKRIDRLIIRSRENIKRSKEQLFIGFVDKHEEIYSVRLHICKYGQCVQILNCETTDDQEVHRFIDEVTQKYPPSEDVPILWMDYGE